MGGLDVIDPGYRPLYERACEVLGADSRVREVVIAGSVGAGTADRWSDLDLQVIAYPDQYDVLLADWPHWVDAITPTVFARAPIAPFIINAVTGDGLTLDFTVYSGEAPSPWSAPAHYTVGMLSSQRFDDVRGAVEYAVAEQLRGLAGPFISLVHRGEHMRHLTGIPHILGLLTTVFVAETGAPPPAKHWNVTFTEEQRAAVAALPPASATREGVVGFGLGVAELLVSRARPLFDRFGLAWPSALAAVAADRLRAELGIDTADWLH